MKQDTKVALGPSQRRTLQSARETIPLVLVSETALRDGEYISGTPVPRAMEGRAKAINWQVVERTNEKTAEVPRVQSVGKTVSALVAWQRPVLLIQVVKGEELHEDADDSRSNVFGRDESDAVEFSFLIQETGNPKIEQLSPNKEEQNDRVRIPEKPEVHTWKTRVHTAERIHWVR